MAITDQDAAVVDWLLEGDPSIRWQVMRDLLDEPPAVWEEERRRTLEEGWVGRCSIAGVRAASGRPVAGPRRRGRCCCSSRSACPNVTQPPGPRSAHS